METESWGGETDFLCYTATSVAKIGLSSFWLPGQSVFQNFRVVANFLGLVFSTLEVLIKFSETNWKLTFLLVK